MEFKIKKAEINDAPAIAEVIRRVWEQVEKKEWFVPDDEVCISEALRSGKGLAYLAVEENTGETAGVFVAVFPGNSEQNLGWDIGLEPEKLSLVAHMDSAAVPARYRGHRLQYRLMQAGEQELRKLGYRYLMCTVHPENQFSRNNIIRQGYEVAMTKEKYGGYLRDIFIKDLIFSENRL